MAIQDKTIILKGDQTKLLKLEVAKKADGSFTLIAFGVTNTAGGQEVLLEAGKEDVPASNPVLSGIWDKALTALRKQNGLE